MDSYDRVMAALKGNREELDYIPCISTTSTCTLELMERFNSKWPDIHRDPEKMARIASAAHRVCGLDMITIPFDMVVEAELFGVSIDYHEDKRDSKYGYWPTRKKPLSKTVVPLIPPENIPQQGRVPTIVKAIKILKEEFGGKVPINVHLVPPFTSISYYIIDTASFFVSLIRGPEKVKTVLDEALPVYLELAKIYSEAGADTITLHDMGASSRTINPIQFEDLVKPYIKRITQNLETTILNICGPTIPILKQMVECGATAIAVDETNPMRDVRSIVDKTKLGYPIIGNLSPKNHLAEGTPEQISEAVKNAIQDGVNLVAPGCDLILETPTQNLCTMVEATKKYGIIK
ncbi:MAG: uroporphyrinogen decarboxylase family protein [Candidatus Jordarchaeaceae archaeon]